MRVDVEVIVDAPREDVGRLVSDIENAASVVSGIDRIEVLERPGDGLLGLRWRETRTLFGKTAIETMRITEAGDDYYVTEARSHGSVYRSRVELTEREGGTRIGMTLEAEPKSLGAKFMSVALGFLMKGATRKALLQDLMDLKEAAESRKEEGLTG
jgi:hypothetical protein